MEILRISAISNDKSSPTRMPHDVKIRRRCLPFKGEDALFSVFSSSSYKANLLPE